MKVRVRVFLRSGRKFYEAQWSDPVTGKKRTRSTKRITKRDAERFAAKLEADIEEGRFESRHSLTWQHFRKRYEEEAFPALAIATRKKMRVTFNAVENLISPKFLAGLDADQISKFQKKIRDNGQAEATIKSQLASLKAALGWAKELKLIRDVPAIKMPERVNTMKGRAPTREEFNAIKAQAAEVAGTENAASWQEQLDGLWWSGLRLAEAVALHWTDDRYICVDFAGRHPMFRIQAQAEKGNSFRLLPIAPEFAEWLRKVPTQSRRGFVFNPRGADNDGRLSVAWVGRMISRMGEKAEVKVAERPAMDSQGNRTTAVKFASAHDFRRAYGFRWAMRVMPAVLQELMRHASIQTTMEYYVGRNADATADQIWRAFANESANTSKNQSRPPRARRK